MYLRATSTSAAGTMPRVSAPRVSAVNHPVGWVAGGGPLLGWAAGGASCFAGVGGRVVGRSCFVWGGWSAVAFAGVDGWVVRLVVLGWVAAGGSCCAGLGGRRWALAGVGGPLGLDGRAAALQADIVVLNGFR